MHWIVEYTEQGFDAVDQHVLGLTTSSVAFTCSDQVSKLAGNLCFVCFALLFDAKKREKCVTEYS